MRVISASHHSLERLVEQGRFRADLFYRCLLYTSRCV
ncbi:sigma 54-interacting transcriptional regulator [Erwinia amylovora]